MATTVDSRRETVSLIGSDKVESTPVYGADDRKIGTVPGVMIDKISGKVAYAVARSAASWAWARTTTRCRGLALSTTPILGAMGSASRKTSLRALPNIAETLNGIGRIGAETKQSTTIIVPRCGTLDVIKGLGENPPSLFSESNEAQPFSREQ